MAKPQPPKATQFKPGQTGNPAGRPKKLPSLDRLLGECLGEDGKEAVAILKAVIDKAKKGDIRAAEVILDRLYGKARQGLDITSLGESINQNAKIDYTLLSESALKELLNATTITNETDKT